MAQRRWLAKTLMFLMLELGALFGVPMRPEQIEELTRMMNGTKAVELRHEEQDDDPI